MGRGFREFKDSISGDSKDEHDRFAVPAEEPEISLTASTPESPPVIPPTTRERMLSRFVREDEKVA